MPIFPILVNFKKQQLLSYYEYVQTYHNTLLHAFLHKPPFHHTKLYNIMACDHDILQQHITLQTSYTDIYTYIYIQLFGQLRYVTYTPAQIGNEYVLLLSQQTLHNTSSIIYGNPAAATFSNHIASIQL